MAHEKGERSMDDMVRRFFLVAVYVLAAANALAQGIPPQLWGMWIVKRDLPTTTIGCWSENDVKKLLGTKVEYTAERFRWEKEITSQPDVKVEALSAEQFETENSGGGANDSRVNFRQLGITAPRATQVTIAHAPANITGATIEVPGDRVLIKGPNVIVFSVCNVYFEARRLPSSQSKPR